jgi:GST-like protein
MAGQANHLRNFAPEKVACAINRYINGVNRLFGVKKKRLAHCEDLAGDYSIADMACVGWTKQYVRLGLDRNEFPHLKRWLDTMLARPGVQRGLVVTVPDAGKSDLSKDKAGQAILLGQRAR